MSEFSFVTEASKCPTCNADAIDRSEFWEASPDNGKELEAIVAKVRKAVQNYYLALDRRQHGGVAQGIALNRIEQALGMNWVRGETTAFVDAHPMLKNLYD